MDRLGAFSSTPSAQLSRRQQLRVQCVQGRPLAAASLRRVVRPAALPCPRAAAAAALHRRPAVPGRKAYVQPLRAVAMSGAQDSLTSADSQAQPLEIEIDNEAEREFTLIRVEGRGQGDALLAALSSGLQQFGVNVNSAAQQSEDGMVLNVFKVTTTDGKKVPKERWDGLRDLVQNMASTTKVSNQPAIYGQLAAADVMRLKGQVQPGLTTGDAVALELAAAEMAQAAAVFVALEKEMDKLRAKGADGGVIALKDTARQEAAAVLERKMAAMEACLAARRVIAVPEQPKTAAEMMAEQMKAAVTAPPSVTSTGPAAGNGYEILLQAFNWESHKRNWYKDCIPKVADWAKQGFTAIWLPPPSDSVSPQGYLPRDLYQLDSCYGSEAELRELIQVCHQHNIKVIADIVVNHRCATYQGEGGKWNKFGGRLAWDNTAICNNNPAWSGRGAHKTGDDYPAAPNIDHTQERIQNDIIEWLRFLKNSIGFDGWRYDFVRGYGGQFVKIYTDATVPEMAFGEYWDTCEYTDGVLNYNQDAHRQRTVNWVDATGGTNAAFDFTTKGILQEALGRNELWRLVDAQGRPPGFVGMWPSRAITFIDNHDTGSTLNHWPFPNNHLQEGYAYILTHPGTPCVFYDHLYAEGGLRECILDLLAVRKRHNLDVRAKVQVRKAAGDVYAATINDAIAVKIGRGDWSPNSARIEAPGGKQWVRACNGKDWACWEVGTK
uniref:Alpha-amylase n=1 Tax=Tetradesmus obliquus TaxID=3088 RepID=A0A383VU35_TETOB|eukprot:jgi/Sobl393_1/17133/SZX68274.1